MADFTRNGFRKRLGGRETNVCKRIVLGKYWKRSRNNGRLVDT